MMQGAPRRKGSVSERDASNPVPSSSARSQTPSRQFPDRKTTTSSSSKLTSARSSSAPKQRNKNSSSSSGAANASTAPAPPSPYDAALAKMAQATVGKSDDELQLLLQRLLQTAQYRDAAYLIAASASLSAKFKTSDVVRLMLEAKQFDATAQLIREMALQSNQLLVTLFVKELVRSAQFHAAVRYAQEFVQNFGKRDFGPRELERPSWTPQALIQAMVRAQQFKTALKFAKQFALLETFAPLPLVASMFDARQWDDGVSSVMEYRLFSAFPIDALVQTMLHERQWSLAVKCMNKVTEKAAFDACAAALVRAAARAGDFVVALQYLREFKLDQAPEHRALLMDLVDTMVTFSEMYKAIKYAIKFGLSNESADGDKPSPSNSSSRFDTAHLIRQAIAIGQFHVATFYIKKLRLKDAFANELVAIEAQKRARLTEFRDFVGFREAQAQHPALQHELAALLGDRMVTDADFVELEPVTRDVVVSEEVEVVPRTKRSSPAAADQAAAPDATAEATETPPRSDHHSVVANTVETSRPDTERQSRFTFARHSSGAESAAPSLPASTATAQRTTEASPLERPSGASLPPPGLGAFAPPAPRSDSDASGSSFNFAAFANALQSNGSASASVSSSSQQQQQMSSRAPPPPGMMHPPMPSMQMRQQPPPMHHHYHQQQQEQQAAPHGGMYTQHGNAPPNQFGRGPGAPPPPPPPSFAPLYHQSSGNGFMPNQAPPSYMMPPPPPPPSSMPQQQNSSNGGFGGMDIASLAMQFHSGGGRGPLGGAPPPPPPAFGMSNSNGNSNGGGMAYPPQMGLPQPPAGAPPTALNHLFPSFAPPPPPPQFGAPPPPRTAFKPSITYTSVTTTRQKK